MMRLIATTVLALIGNAIGLIVAAAVLEDMTLSGAAFVVEVVIFTLTYVIVQPLAVKTTLRRSSTLAGGSALLATLAALIVADVLSDGMSITGVATWLLATLIVWLVSVVAGALLPLVLFKKALGRATAKPVSGARTWG
jgi:putative membrane protein